MKLQFLGANRQVTGSRYCLEAANVKLLIDCGLVQERPYLGRNWEACPVPAGEIAALLLTHIHIDHCGLIPKFVAEGFQGPIYATPPSVDLAELMLRDAARIQTEDAQYKKRRHQREKRQPRFPTKPLYTESDVDKTLPLLQAVDYRKPLRLGDAFTVTFHDAGHILGSSILEIVMRENGRQQRIVFSGDVGQIGKPLLQDPTFLQHADHVVMESTYGDREHFDGGDIGSQLCDIINKTIRRGGNVVIPTFALERAQELMYYIGRLVHEDRIPDIKIFLDSPMAVDATEIFRRNHSYFDDEAKALIDSDEPPLRFPGLQFARSVDDSKGINDYRQPCIIMATSGMCTAGRIKHHLRANVGRKESTVLFVGYQGSGTLGRQILEGKKVVRIHGRQWKVRAEIGQIFGFSGHADRNGLMQWVSHFSPPPKRVYLTHGEAQSSQALAHQISGRMETQVTVPEYLDSVELG